MDFEVPARKTFATTTLFARGVEESNAKWIRDDAKAKNISLGEYLNAVIANLRKGSSKKTVLRKSSKPAAKKSKPRTRARL